MSIQEKHEEIAVLLGKTKEEIDKLGGGIKAAAPRARKHLATLAPLVKDLRKAILDHHKSLPTKKRQEKPKKAEVVEVKAEEPKVPKKRGRKKKVVKDDKVDG
jgi:hypothetical protein